MIARISGIALAAAILALSAISTPALAQARPEMQAYVQQLYYYHLSEDDFLDSEDTADLLR